MCRGKVWLINLDPTVGSEIRKTRPAIIVNDDAIGILPLKAIVPITDWKEHYSIAPWMVRVKPDQMNGLQKLSAADALQVRSVSQERFIRKLGNLPVETMDAIGKSLAVVLSLSTGSVLLPVRN
ncbi:MAG: type II toxin-antitoxin system PemK/MazF family toxin [Chloroflexi bacterium]|nr:type II toxin-antitoxin system PemK/MazF family toxin [Ardenticatenaceae bacterium]MBL1130853.1 type II toxin-antitoxin system PemK/MazF family toxin [Chloroflexota bacterium]NOG36951.1 type II toxin-antitoxin system PemK/MazF family toxin [Chloroflexota bacterium]GIK54524.1 MAG: mRNA interferase PemK [Chloroflexota bacterium]